MHDHTLRVERIADSLLDAMADETSVDLLESYASPLSVLTICELIGTEASDGTEFQSGLTTQVSTADVAKKHAAAANSEAYVCRLFEQRKKNGGEDLECGACGASRVWIALLPDARRVLADTVARPAVAPDGCARLIPTALLGPVFG
ncbi:cytochrome P450 (plasmid) [Streptomyces decoyicus]|uniref:hypothetical protein n=1 Tax=Streptomyces decoyicus TaxID=249567 RepID=UPI002E2EA691|nr:hypothetical protein [Streptomyces decoyicus]